jgi:hypothetical protein
VQLLIESQNLTEMALQVADVVADPSNAEFAEIGQVLADLGGIEMELLGERLRGDRANAGAVQHVETAQVDGKTICRKLRDLFETLAGSCSLVRSFHKPPRL